MFREIYDFLKNECPTVKNAKFTVMALCILSAILGYHVADWHLEERVRVYETKLAVTSPDEAVDKMIELRRNIEVANESLKDLINQKVQATSTSTPSSDMTLIDLGAEVAKT